jgi:hypothetical protein
MLYEIGIGYDSDTVKDAQVFIPKVPISINRRKFWYGGRSIPHWNETTDPWVKVPVLQKGTTKIYVDDSANKDLSNIDATMIFGDDFNKTSLDTNKWTKETSDNGSLTIVNNPNYTLNGTNVLKKYAGLAELDRDFTNTISSYVAEINLVITLEKYLFL